ncbi:MAG: hypothetical protein JNK98_01715 [Chitinophagaceae bacterium]|nr:hypothetical protein [Chitinophagaceae bacterium]
MKGFLFLIFLTGILKVFGQNEFAATAFYNEFKKIYADAKNGFVENKGSERVSEFPELTKEYKVKMLLPLADSGKIVESAKGSSYVVYFFEPDKVRLKVDQRGAHLRDAILTSVNQPLYARTETVMTENKPLSNTWYFTDPKETKTAAAAFKLSIYFKDGKYFLSLEIRGNKMQ